jgi:Leucine-rich repeat (LRR) protein
VYKINYFFVGGVKMINSNSSQNNKNQEFPVIFPQMKTQDGKQVYSLECDLLTRFPFNQLISFIKEHPNKEVWNRRYEVLGDVFQRKESLSFKELKAFKTLLMKAPLTERGSSDFSWRGFSQKYQLNTLKSLDLFKVEELNEEDIIAISTLCPGLTSINLGWCLISDEGMRTILKNCPHLTSISLAYSEINDSFVSVIAENCPNLRSIDLQDCHLITDASLVSLQKNCDKIEEIFLQGTRVSNEGIKAFTEKFRDLRGLYLGHIYNQLNDQTIKTLLKNCPNLKDLYLIGVRVTDQVLIEIAKNSGLNSLYLSSTEITRQGISFIVNSCHQLKTLCFGEASRLINDEILYAIAENCPKLFWIDLDKSQISNEALLNLSTKCQSLAFLSLRESGMNRETLSQIREQHPKIIIGRDGRDGTINHRLEYPSSPFFKRICEDYKIN